jgi:glycosyltransferase involved in cell wall biosynthesis
MRNRAIRVLQATAWYPPYHIGGTEVYLEGLVGELRALGVESSVLVPRHPGAAITYAYAGTPVETYPVSDPAPDEMRDGRPHFGFSEFQARLAAHRGAVYHQHAWSRGCGPHHLHAARELGLATVLTVHVPGAICLRGTMLRYGTRPCDGRVEERTCGACWAQGRGMPRPLAGAVARLPLPIARRARGGRTRAATALAARALGAERRAQLAEMIRNADRVVAVCAWLHEALAANGVPPARLVLSRQGLPSAYLDTVRAPAAATWRDGHGALRLLYVGRWHPVKGIDVIVRAVRALPGEANVQLTVHAVSGTDEEAAYGRSVRTLAGVDPRIVFAPPLARSEVAEVMARHDALVVPSQCLETGPLVVLEAQAAGLYVMGSRLGGIAELVADGASGELVEAGSVLAWTAAVARLAERRASGTLACRPGEVRSMAAVAAEMAALYQSLWRD